MSKLYLILVAFSVIMAGSIMIFYQPATSETTTQYDVVTHVDRLGMEIPGPTGTEIIILSESVALTDEVTVSKP